MIVLKTIHGSHLYNMAHSLSDRDIYSIYRYPYSYLPKKLSKQTIRAGEDINEVHASRFNSCCVKGVPQAIETLFIPPEYWIEHSDYWLVFKQLIIDDLSAYKDDILDSYKRTIMNFFKEDHFKMNRHGFRLLINAKEFNMMGRVVPNLDSTTVNTISDLANLTWSYKKEKYLDMLFDTFGG